MQEYMSNIAYLAVNFGINVKKGDTVFVSSPIQAVELARKITQIAYEAGAANVVVNFSDDFIAKQKLLNAPDSVLENFPQYEADKFNSQLKNKDNFCTISIIANDPNSMKGVPPEKFSLVSNARYQHMKGYYEAASNDEFRWTVIAFPTQEWADAAGTTLDDLIVKVSSASQAIGTQEQCMEKLNQMDDQLQRRCNNLNQHKFKKFIYQSKVSQFTVDMHESAIFLGGSTKTNDNLQQKFFPNIPTYEVFSAPLNCNGTIFSTKPISYNGNLIKDFNLTFVNGEVTSFEAKEGRQFLEQLLNTDEGSKRLGEIAFVSQDSPVQNTGFLFYETLFDENASCHFALGNAYTVCGTGDWLNKSQKHVDFMVGSDDMNITGISDNGNEVSIMKNGIFVGEFL